MLLATRAVPAMLVLASCASTSAPGPSAGAELPPSAAMTRCLEEARRDAAGSTDGRGPSCIRIVLDNELGDWFVVVGVRVELDTRVLLDRTDARGVSELEADPGLLPVHVGRVDSGEHEIKLVMNALSLGGSPVTAAQGTPFQLRSSHRVLLEPGKGVVLRAVLQDKDSGDVKAPAAAWVEKAAR